MSSSDRSTFSPFWHRVRALKPRLRPHVQITRQHYRGGRWHVVHDPASNAFYRLSPVSHEFVGMLDGKRTVEEVWEQTLSRHGDEAPTQNEVIQLISQLHTANLLSVDVTPETEQLLRRGRERLSRRFRQQAIGLMYFKIRLLNPDRILTWLEPIFRPLISRVGLVMWLAWIIAGLTAVVGAWDQARSEIDTVMAPANWGWMMLVFVVVKLIHETGHGVICKRFGGQVPEFGVFMLVLVPAPYVDASSAWALPSKWKRMAVGAGGMIFELTIAAAAAWIWRMTPPGALMHQLAFNAMFMTSVSTIIFNANPLMKFDGYYILSDLLEVPNLMQRSFMQLSQHFKKWVYRMRGLIPVTHDPGEAMILNTYAIGALAYRVFLFISITLYVMGQMFALGLILAVWTAAMWFLLPALGFAHWLATNPGLSDKRPRAILVSLLMIAGGLGLIGLVPMPDHRRADGVVASEERTGVYFGVDGFVETAHKRPGDFVKKGEAIVTLRSHVLDSHLRIARAQLDEARALELRAVAYNPTAAQVASERVRAFDGQVKYLEDRVDRLVVRAPHDGIIVGADPANFVGAFADEGKPLCEVVAIDPAHVRVTASLTQSEALWLNELPTDGYKIEVRRRADPARVGEAKALRIPQAGLHQLAHPALGYAGGGTIETEQQDRSGRRSKRALFEADFRLADEAFRGTTLYPGERVKLRFTLEDKPLLTQWVDRLQKLMLGRARV